MPRGLANILPVQRFGGLFSARGPRGKDARHCQDCLNVVTHDGVIAVRPGGEYVGNTPTDDGHLAASIVVGGTRLLYGFEADAGIGRHFWMTSGGTVFRISPSLDPWPSVVQVGPVCYFWNGHSSGNPIESSIKLYDVAGVVTNAYTGIARPAPAATPTVALGGAGALTGTFTYRCTYYNANTGTESPASAESASIAPAAQSVNVTVTASADLQVTNIRIYRKQSTVDGTWYFLQQVANASGPVNDNTATISKLNANAIDLVSDVPPYSEIGAWHRRRMFLAIGTEPTSTVVYSEFDKPELVNALNDLTVGDRALDFVRALHPAFGYLLSFNRAALYAITGDGPSSFVVQKIAQAGCSSPKSVVEIEGALYWAGDNTVYRFDGSRVENIGNPDNAALSNIGPLREWFDDSTSDGLYIKQLIGSYEPHTHSYVLSGVGKGSGGAARQLVYNIRDRAWTRWDLPAWGMTPHTWFINRAAKRMYYFSRNTRQAVAFGGVDSGDLLYTDPGGADISWNWRSPKIDAGLMRRKRWHYFGAAWNWSGGSKNIALQYATDDNSSVAASSATRALNGGSSTGQWRLARRSRALEFRLSGDVNNKLEVTAVELQAETAGAR